MTHLSVFVPGIPQPGGSKRGFPIRRKGGGLGVAMSDSNPKVHPWRADVKMYVHAAMLTKSFSKLAGAVSLSVAFTLPRPKSHYKTSKRTGITLLRSDAPTWHTSRPDTTKLLRAVEDALKGVVWDDDCQVALQAASKQYGETPGALIGVSEIDNAAAADTTNQVGTGESDSVAAATTNESAPATS